LSSLLHTHKKNIKDKNNPLKLEETQFYNHLLSMDVEKLDTNLKIELLPCTAPWFTRAIRAWWSAPPEAIPDIQQMISFYVSLQKDHIHFPVL
jgi:hypothetical protein